MTDKTRPVGTVVVDGLRFFAHHGVFPQERIVGNMFEVSISLKTDSETAMREDRLDLAVNYAEIVDLVKMEMAVPSKLLENVVYRIYRSIMGRYPAIKGGKVAVYKLQPPISAELEKVGFEFEW